MTPNAIEILIHCHVCQLPHPRKDSPAVAEELRHLQLNGMIEKAPGSPECYITTDRGSAHIEQLCRTEWPVKAWIGANGKRIEEPF